MSGTNFTVARSIDRSVAEPFEVGAVQWIRRPGDGGREALSAGFWFVSPQEAPEPVVVVGHADETVYVVEGRLRIEPDGQDAIELTAGGSFSINQGVPATWTVLEPTIEFFIYS